MIDRHRALAVVLWACVCGAAASAGPGSVAHPSGQTERLADLIDQYRRGDADGAVRAFAAWNAGRVGREARPAQSVEADPWAWAALLMLHREALNAVPGLGPRWHVHSQAVVRALRETLYPYVTRSQNAALLTFCVDWYDMTLPYQNSTFFEDTSFLSDQPEMLLARGRWLEYWMGPEIEGGRYGTYGFVAARRPLITTSHGQFGTYSGLAIYTFRRTLEQRPDLTEARLRLGRVLYLLDRNDDAQREWDKTLVRAPATGDVSSAYLAALFLGQLHEAEGRIAAAADAYRTAIAVYPRFPSAPVGLARLLIASGQAAEATAVVEQLFQHADEAGSVATDPWWAYPRGEAFWTKDERLRRLRAMVRAR